MFRRVATTNRAVGAADARVINHSKRAAGAHNRSLRLVGPRLSQRVPTKCMTDSHTKPPDTGFPHTQIRAPSERIEISVSFSSEGARQFRGVAEPTSPGAG